MRPFNKDAHRDAVDTDNYFSDLRGDALAMTAPTEHRDFGVDTMQLAIGPMPGAGSKDDGTGVSSDLELTAADYKAALDGLGRAARSPHVNCARGIKLGRGIVLSGNVRVARLSAEYAPDDQNGGYRTPSKGRSSSAKKHARRSEHHEFTITVQSDSGRSTVVTVTLRRVNGHDFWLNVRANPTALLAGHNAFAVAFEGVSAGDKIPQWSN